MAKFKHIYIEITNICNLSCAFCPKTTRAKKTMTVQEFKIIADKVCGKAHSFHLHVMGEPLMHSEIDEILSICDKNNMNIYLTTNGVLLDHKKEILIAHSCIKKLNISLHSYFQNDNSKSDTFSSFFNRIEKSVDYILKNSNIYVNYKVWDTKIAEDIFKETGTKKISNRITLSVEKEFVWPINENNINDKNQVFCLGLKSQVAILSNGTVIPCCLDSEGINKLGNIFESETLEDCVNSSLATLIKDGFKNGYAVTQLCKNCTFRDKFTV